MTVTQSGWPASKDASALGIKPLVVAGRSFPGGVRGGAPLTCLRYMATQYHLRVESLYFGETDKDDWGYSYRPIAGTSVISEHGGGVAIDVNATTNPQGAAHSHTYAQELMIRRIMREALGAVLWGRDFSHHDPMHFQLVPYDERAKVEAAAKRINNPPWFHRQIDPGMSGPDVAYARRRMGLTSGNVWDAKAVYAMRAIEKRMGITQTGKCAKSRAIILGSNAP